MERPLKIGITCYPSVGGSGILASALGVELANRGHEVHFISYERPFRMPTDAPRLFFHPVVIDVSAPEIISAWTAAMEAHASQMSSRNYVELQLTRARLLGARAGVEFASALFPNEPLVFESLAQAGRGARKF